MNNKKFLSTIFMVLMICSGSFLIFFNKWDIYYLLRNKTFFELNHQGCAWGITSSSNTVQGHVPISNIYSLFQDDFPINLLKNVNHNSIAVITWEPFDKVDKNQSILPEITSGKYDEHILKFALDAKKFRHKIILRFGHEMNGDWYPWSGFSNNKSPNLFIQSFRKIHKIFKNQKINNVIFAFSINGNDVPHDDWNRFENYYPGDDVVDLISIDSYNIPQNPLSPKRLLEEPYERAIQSFPKKPIIIGEIGSSSKKINKTQWIDKLFEVIPHRFPAIKAIIWFDIDKEEDWGVSQNPIYMKLIWNKIKQPYYNVGTEKLTWMFQDEKR